MPVHNLDVANTKLWLRIEGTLRQVPLAPLSRNVLRTLEPVRDTTAHRSRRPQIAAEFYSETMLGLVKTESMAEQSRVLIADYDADVETIISQPLTIRTPFDGRIRQHSPDLLLGHLDGHFTLVNVRPSDRQNDPAFQRANFIAAAAADQLGFGYETCGGYAPVVLGNLRVLNGYKRCWLFNQDDVRHIVAFVDSLQATNTGRLTFEQLLDQLVPHLPRHVAHSHVLHALWHHHLHTDLTVPLGGTSPITRTQEVACIPLRDLALVA